MTLALTRNWRLAWRGVRRLHRNTSDIAAVMIIIQALEGNRSIMGQYRRLGRSEIGRQQLEAREELSERLADRGFLSSFAPGTVGAAYLEFMDRRPISARRLADHLLEGPNGRAIRTHSPVSWFARRMCDLHDILHVLTGYDYDPQGEGCLMGFTYAQLGSLGYLTISIGSAIKFGPAPIIEGYLHGRRAAWLFDMDVDALFAEPLDAARARLGIVQPARYRIAA